MALGAVALGVLIGGLVILYLTKPRKRDVKLSSARFFQDAPVSDEPQHRLRIENLLLSPPFYLQLAVLLLLLLGFLLSRQHFEKESDFLGVGLWIAVDTSASMSTAQGRADRMALAQQEIDNVLSALKNRAEEQVTCLALATFDQELTVQMPQALIEQVSENSRQLTPRALGTDITLLRSLLQQISDPDLDNCRATHLLVVTDLPAPDWIGSAEQGVEIIWRDIAEPAGNVGLVDVRRKGTALFGQQDQIEIDLAAYGLAQGVSEVMVTGPDGTSLLSESIAWDEPGSKHVSFVPLLDGEYRIDLSAGGAYGYDDQAIISVERNKRLRVDWRLADQAVPQALGWQLDSAAPQLRVMSYPGEVDQVPTLLVGNAYQAGTTPRQIAYFEENNCLLADLNFDVAESLDIAGEELPADTPLRPIMSGDSPEAPASARTWLALGADPPAAYVPGLPTFTADSNLDNFSATAFFNGVRCLLQEEKPAPLFTLTTPAEPIPEGSRIALHPGEGNTAWSPLSYGETADIQPVPLRETQEPVWPIVVAIATLVVAVERGLAFLGGARWR